MMQDCFIGIDQGSSATKAIALSKEGGVLFRTRKDLPPAFRDGPRIEQDAMQLLASVREVLETALRLVREMRKQALGIGLSCQRSSCLAWNESTGEPLSPVISWRDTRGIETVRDLAGSAPLIFSRSGLPLTPYYSASKFRWMCDQSVVANQADAVFGSLSSFLVQQLTGSRRAVIDHTNAARTQLMNIHTLSWDDELLAAFGVTGIRLPGIRPTAFSFGEAGTAAGAVPLLACLGDQQAAMIGLGVLNRGDGAINYGTGGFLMVNTGTELVPAPGLMSSVQYSTGRERTNLLEGSVNAVGDALEWSRSRLGLFREYEEVDDLCRKAATDVIAFIGLNGTGAPHWESEISSALHGLKPESASADIVRAVVEGIAFFMKDIAEALHAAGVEPASFTLSGGLSSLGYLVQVQADILGKDISIPAEQEASAVGAALLAGMEHGEWTAGEVKAFTVPERSVSGEPNPGLERRYRRWKELHTMTKRLDKVSP